jgi:hypothetical protein
MYREVGEDVNEEAETNKKDWGKKMEQAEDAAKILVENSSVVKTYSEMPAAERKQNKKRNAPPTKIAPPPSKVQKVKGARKKEDPLVYIGLRVAKYFGSEVFFGTIKNFISPTMKNDVDLWHVVYDDDDQEDFDHKDLRKAIALYKSNQQDDKVSRVSAVAGIGEEIDDKPAEDVMVAEPVLEVDAANYDAAQLQESEVSAMGEAAVAVAEPVGDEAGSPFV